MKDRDEEIKDLIKERATIENEKRILAKQMDELKIEKLLQKNVNNMMMTVQRPAAQASKTDLLAI
jgi:hypothetical protein